MITLLVTLALAIALYFTIEKTGNGEDMLYIFLIAMVLNYMIFPVGFIAAFGYCAYTKFSK